ncbi:MAG: helix-turn-helix domain-containing protein [Solirubrobacteraceae bacterium]
MLFALLALTCSGSVPFEPPPPETDRDPWLTLAEIADELRVNASTVRLWVSQGRLGASRAGRRKWLVRRSELERFVAASGSSEPRPADAGAGPVRPPMPGDRLIFDPGGGEGEESGG